jgi:hypothetical protein
MAAGGTYGNLEDYPLRGYNPNGARPIATRRNGIADSLLFLYPTDRALVVDERGWVIMYEIGRQSYL